MNLSISSPATTSPIVEPADLQGGRARSGGVLGKFVANLGYGGLRGLVFLLNSLIVAPVLMFRLGPEVFALFALATPFMRYGFNGVFDFGLATALARFVSREAVASNHKNINRYVTSALVLYLAFGSLLALVYRELAPLLLPHLLSYNSGLYGSANAILGRCLWIYFMFLSSNLFFGLLVGIQKVPSTHLVGTASLLIELLGIVALLFLGVTITRVIWVYFINAAASMALCAGLAWWHWPQLRLRFALISRRCVFDLVHYTARYSVTVSTTLLGPVIDKLILTWFVGLSFVAAYEAAARLAEIFKRVTQLFLLPLFPLAGAMEKTHTTQEKRQLYSRIFSANLVLSAGLYLIPSTLALAVLPLWVGPSVGPTAATAFIVLAGTSFLLTLVNPAVTILAGTGRMTLLIATGLAGLFSNVFISSALAKVFGFKGLLAGTALAYGGVSLVMLYVLQHMPEFRLRPRQLLRTFVVSVGAAVVPGLLVGIIWRQPGNLLETLVVAMLLVLLYSAAALAIGENRRLLFSASAHLRSSLGSLFFAREAGQTSHA